MGWVIFIGVLILIGIFVTYGAGAGIAVLLGLGGLGFGIFKIWEYSDDTQWDELARKKIANAISKADGVELISTSSQGRKQAKEALETANAAKGLSGYEAFELAKLALELAEEAVKFSKMTDSEVSSLIAKKAELTQKNVSSNEKCPFCGEESSGSFCSNDNCRSRSNDAALQPKCSFCGAIVSIMDVKLGKCPLATRGRCPTKTLNWR